jgi:RNA polymerase sigma-70 factor (ECF subfamily)
MTDAPRPTDVDLLQSVSRGDRSALAALYGRYQGSVYRFARQMSGSTSLAEDVTQEVFLTIIRQGDRYDASRGAFPTYLYGIARNLVLRRLTRERPFVTLDDPASETPVPPALLAGDNPLHELTRSESIEALRRAVASLPPHYREVVILCDLHDLSYADAAAALSCAVGTVRSRLHRGRAILIERLRGDAVASPAASPESARCFA